jgi:hypothetical protein
MESHRRIASECAEIGAQALKAAGQASDWVLLNMVRFQNIT